MKWRKPFAVTVLLISFILQIAPHSFADAAPYQGYNYSFWGEAVPSPVPYIPQRIITGANLQVGNLNAPEDLHVDNEGRVYIADTGNNRILLLDENWNLSLNVEHFLNNGQRDSFLLPSGLFVDNDGLIYVADTGNKRIVVLDQSGELVRIIEKPQSDILRKDFDYIPVKVAVDKAKRVYVVSRGNFDGIIEFDIGNQFAGFIGTNKVKFNPVDLFWKRISTKEQRGKMEMFVPLEFNNLDIDQDGFIYTTTMEKDSEEPIKRLNPSGKDVLRREGYFSPKGDIQTTIIGTMQGSSMFVDAASGSQGIYHVLDFNRGRIFTYDKDGNLLHQFGQRGEQEGNFRTPVAIDVQFDHLAVLDKSTNRITLFEETAYGKTIREAVGFHYSGEMEKATKAWEDTLHYNANFEIAYVGIGKSLLMNGDAQKALQYFEHGNSRYYYSKAFNQYRKQILWQYFSVFMFSFIILVVGFLVWRKWKKKKIQHYEERGALGTTFYTLFHPFNGFWELKYEKKGKLSVALAILGLLVIVMILHDQFSGFLVNYNNKLQLNSMDQLKYVVLPFFLWCIANWSLTTLMDGEGRFKEIVMSSGYALLPLALVYAPLIIFGNVIILEEVPIYRFLQLVGYVWFLWMLFVGTLTVHQYSASKTIVTMLLTVVVMGIYVFLGLLFFSLAQQMVVFFTSIYQEVTYRF